MEQHYITAQEFWQITSIITATTIGTVSLIVGIVMAIMKGSINTKVFDMIAETKEELSKIISKSEDEVKEIKNNYLDRFEELHKVLSSINKTLGNIETSISYIKEEQDRIRRKHND